MKITAHYSESCYVCNSAINVGDRIDYTDAKVRCLECIGLEPPEWKEK